MTRDVQWVDQKVTDPAETLKLYCKVHKGDLVPVIEEDKIPIPEPEEKMPNEEESGRQNGNLEKS